MVKGVKFVELRDAGDPVEIAAAYDEQGADELDLPRHHRQSTTTATPWSTWCARTAERVFMPLTVGGGIRTVRRHPPHAQRRGRQGVDQHRRRRTTPSSCARPPSASAPSASVVAIDATPVPGADRRAGRSTPTAGASHRHRRGRHGRDAWTSYGAGEILLTSMDRDGTKDGYDLPLTRAIVDAVSIPVIASGGVGTLEHLYDGFAVGWRLGCLAASIFRFRHHTVGEAKEYLKGRGVPVRIF
ncbi:MAG: HisA/HisF-related TIM barrel protein [Comamonadaceae bacterium]|nr:HisA/HisF-related TIM barrel protein [Comamonadaceae bacterium]